MGMHQIERQFTRIGARAKIHPPVVNRWTKVEGVSIDIGNDAEGEFFDISVETTRACRNPGPRRSANAAALAADVGSRRRKAQVPVRSR